jgi:hypothetical protein
MRFQAKKDSKESREYWESISLGAKEYDKLPAWKKGVLGRTDRSVPERTAEAASDTRERDGGSGREQGTPTNR